MVNIFLRLRRISLTIYHLSLTITKGVTVLPFSILALESPFFNNCSNVILHFNISNLALNVNEVYGMHAWVAWVVLVRSTSATRYQLVLVVLPLAVLTEPHSEEWEEERK